MNEITLVGRIGKDAEYKQVGERGVINFTMATSDNYINKQGVKIEDTDWHNITWWVGSDKILPFLTKGTLIGINGKQKNTSKEVDGVIKYFSFVQVKALEFLSSKQDKPQASNTDSSVYNTYSPF